MKKKELKSKMIVKQRDGEFYLVVDDVIVRENCFNLLSNYSEDLNWKDDKQYDIVEVYKIVNNYYSFTNDLGMACLNFSEIGWKNDLKLLWKRTCAYDDGDLIQGEKCWIVNKKRGLTVIYNFDSKDYNEEFKYFCSETTAQLYINVLNSTTFSFNDYVKMSEKEFEEHCENVIREEFLKRFKRDFDKNKQC